jgi:hypothetical protein
MEAAASTHKRAGRALGVILTDEQAIEIYCCKLSLKRPDSFKSSLQGTDFKTKGQSARIAGQYGVSPKTIRDIWNRRTWSYTTAHLWHEEKEWDFRSGSWVTFEMLPCNLLIEASFLEINSLIHSLSFYISGDDSYSIPANKICQLRQCREEQPARFFSSPPPIRKQPAPDSRQ